MIAFPKTDRKSRILDTDGRPFQLQTVDRPPLEKPQEIRARYDAAQQNTEFDRYWANADFLDADSDNSKQVRRLLTSRSRYEVQNNGYTDGMLQTHCNYLVGSGPQLRVETQNRGFNELVERLWKQWSAVIQLRRKLWTQTHAKVMDGEGFGIIRNNPAVPDPIQLYYELIETEQCQSLNDADMPGHVDGIEYDEFGNPIWYDILRYHPNSWNSGPVGQYGRFNPTNQFGLNNQSSMFGGFNEPERVPARFVCHWFKIRRPGMHRAVPEFRSTLTVGAGSRRFREATIAAAETAADFTVMLQTQMLPEIEADYQAVESLSTLPIEKRMMVAMPPGYAASQMTAEHPTAEYKAFTRQQVNEQGRPKSIPVNVGMGDSSEHNFASGKLDHQPWFQEILVERLDCNDVVLDPLFMQWWDEARFVYGFGELPPHTWDWPVLPVADERARAIARNIDLMNGSTYPSAVYSEQGKDFEDELPKMAADYGVDLEDMRFILLNKILGSKSPALASEPVEDMETPAEEAAENNVASEVTEDGNTIPTA